MMSWAWAWRAAWGPGGGENKGLVASTCLTVSVCGLFDSLTGASEIWLGTVLADAR
jgi:hypothetical protein